MMGYTAGPAAGGEARSADSIPSNGLSIRPLSVQLRDTLDERIAMREWTPGPGRTVPNEGNLARECGVSPGTMRRALDRMERERVLTRRHGLRTFVNDQGSHERAMRFCNIRGASGERIAGHAESAEYSEGAANELECERLQLRTHDPVSRIRRVWLHEDRPFMVEEASMPATLFPELMDNRGVPHDIVALAQQHGMLLGKVEERISIDKAAPAVAEALCVAPSSPVMVLDRVMRTLDGCPIEWRVGQCHLFAHHYLVEMS